MKFLGSILLAMLIAGATHAGSRATMADMDQILDRAGSLDNFLKSLLLQNEYFNTAQSYYGGNAHFQRVSYDEVLRQFQVIIEKVPELKERAWRKRQPRNPIVIQSAFPAYGVSFVDDHWKTFLKDQGFISEGAGHHVLLTEIQMALSEIEVSLQLITSSAPSDISDKVRQEMIAEKIKNLKQSALVLDTRNLFLRFISQMPGIQDELLSDLPDVAIDTFTSVRHEPERRLPQLTPFKKSLRLILNDLPRTEAVIHDGNLFLENSDVLRINDSRFDFRDLPRRFHAIFRGIALKECVGGNCDQIKFLNSDRFLIPLLDGGQEIEVLQDGKYAGYLSTTAVTRDGKSYLSLDVMSQAMWKNILITSKTESHPIKKSVFSVWFAQESSRLSRDTQSFVVANTSYMNSASGLYAVRTSGAWLKATDGGDGSEYRAVDPLEQKILSNADPKQTFLQYAGTKTLMYDVGLGAPTKVIQLAVTDFDPAESRTVEWIQKQISGDVFSEALMWTSFFYKSPIDQKAKDLLFNEAWTILKAWDSKKDIQHVHAVNFMSICGTACIKSVIRTALKTRSTFELFMYGMGWIGVMPEQFRFALLTDYLDTHLADAVPLALMEKDDITEIVKRLKSKTPYVGPDSQITRAFLPHAKTPQEFFKFLGLTRLDNLKDYVETFQKLNPSSDDILNFIPKINDVTQAEILINFQIPKTTTASELISLLTVTSIPNPTEYLVELKSRLIRENLNRIFRLHPTIRDLENLKSNGVDTDTWSKLAAYGYSHSISAYEFLTFTRDNLVGSKTTQEKKAAYEIMFANKSSFFDLNPKVYYTEALINIAPYSYQTVKLIKYAISRTKKPSDFIQLARKPNSLNEEYIPKFIELIQSELPKFFELKPTFFDRRYLKHIRPELRFPSLSSRVIGYFKSPTQPSLTCENLFAE